MSGGQRPRGPATLESGSGPQWLQADAWVGPDPNRSQAGTRSRSPCNPRGARTPCGAGSPSFPKAPLASGAAAAPPWQRWPISPPPTPLPGAGASSPAGRGGAGVARKLAKGVRLRGASPLPPFTYISPAEKEVGEGREGGGEATWWPRGSGPFSFEAGPSGPDDVLFPFGSQVLCPVSWEEK